MVFQTVPVVKVQKMSERRDQLLRWKGVLEGFVGIEPRYLVM